MGGKGSGYLGSEGERCDAMSRSLSSGSLHTRRLWTKASKCKASGGSPDGIVIQKPAQCLLALQLGRQGGLDGIIEIQRNDVTDTLMWSAGVMVFFDAAQGVTQMGLAQENQLVEGLSNLAYMDGVLKSDALHLLKTPPHSPLCNSYAERLAHSVIAFELEHAEIHDIPKNAPGSILGPGKFACSLQHQAGRIRDILVDSENRT